MKKWWIVFLIGIVLFFFILSSFFSRPVIIHENNTGKANPRATLRTMLQDSNLQKWWPGTSTQDEKGLHLFYDGYTFDVTDKKLSSLVFKITKQNYLAEGLLSFFPLYPDSVAFSWQVETKNNHLLQAINSHFKSNRLKKDLAEILQKIKPYFSNFDNLYKFHIQKTFVTDSILISTSAESKGYPSTEFIYNLIHQLQHYSNLNGSKQTGYPMLNINTTDSINFLTKVALPVDKKLKSSGKIEYKWMLGGGNILVIEVRGGPEKINEAFEELQIYISDFQRLSPAIPFQSLITDRSQEPDTSKWITKVYWPVM